MGSTATPIPAQSNPQQRYVRCPKCNKPHRLQGSQMLNNHYCHPPCNELVWSKETRSAPVPLSNEDIPELTLEEELEVESEELPDAPVPPVTVIDDPSAELAVDIETTGDHVPKIEHVSTEFVGPETPTE